MAVVLPCVLLDQVDQNPYQAGRPTVGPGAPGQPPPAAVGQRLVDQGAGHGVLPERPKLLGDVLRAECKSQSRLAFQSTVSHGAAGRARAATGAPRVLDVGQVLEDPRRGSSTRGRAWPQAGRVQPRGLPCEGGAVVVQEALEGGGLVACEGRFRAAVLVQVGHGRGRYWRATAGPRGAPPGTRTPNRCLKSAGRRVLGQR
jgi:hypothetical protein